MTTVATSSRNFLFSSRPAAESAPGLPGSVAKSCQYLWNIVAVAASRTQCPTFVCPDTPPRDRLVEPVHTSLGSRRRDAHHELVVRDRALARLAQHDPVQRQACCLDRVEVDHAGEALVEDAVLVGVLVHLRVDDEPDVDAAVDGRLEPVERWW